MTRNQLIELKKYTNLVRQAIARTKYKQPCILDIEDSYLSGASVDEFIQDYISWSDKTNKARDAHHKSAMKIKPLGTAIDSSYWKLICMLNSPFFMERVAEQLRNSCPCRTASVPSSLR